MIQKLRWYRLGGDVSDRQWRDVVGVLKAVGPRLDRTYMERWASTLELTELLERAIGEAGRSEH